MISPPLKREGWREEGGINEPLPRGCPEVSEDELLMMLKTTFSDCLVPPENQGPLTLILIVPQEQEKRGARLAGRRELQAGGGGEQTDASPRRN